MFYNEYTNVQNILQNRQEQGCCQKQRLPQQQLIHQAMTGLLQLPSPKQGINILLQNGIKDLDGEGALGHFVDEIHLSQLLFKAKDVDAGSLFKKNNQP